MKKKFRKYLSHFEKNDLYVPPDGGWGWMAVLGAFATFTTFMYHLTVFSIIFEDTILKMGYETSGVAFIFSGMLGVLYFSGPLTGALVKISYQMACAVGGLCIFFGMLGCFFVTQIYQLFLAYSILVGIGMSLLFNSSFCVINVYFRKWRATANGLASIGLSVSPIIFTPVTTYLRKQYGYSGTVLILSAVSLNVVAASLLYDPLCKHAKRKHLPNTLEMKPLCIHEPRKTNGLTVAVKDDKLRKRFFQRLANFFDLHLLTNLRFLIIMFGSVTIIACDSIVFMLLVLFLRHVAEMGPDDITLCLILRALGEISFRFCGTIATDRFKISARNVILICNILCALLRVALTFTRSVPFVGAILFLEGTMRGHGLGFCVLVLTENCPTNKGPTATGLLFFFIGLVTAILGMLTGYIRDQTGDYSLCIHILSGLLIISMMVWFVEKCVSACKGEGNRLVNLQN